MVVGFPFKRDVEIGFCMIPIHNQPDKIFAQVKEIEWEYTQLELLPQVNLFMVEQGFIGVAFPDEDEREQRHSFHMQYRRPEDETLKSHLNRI